MSPSFAEMRSYSAWAENVDAFLKKGRADKTTMVTNTIKVYYTTEVKQSVKNIKMMDDGPGYCNDQPGVHQQQDPP